MCFRSVPVVCGRPVLASVPFHVLTPRSVRSFYTRLKPRSFPVTSRDALRKSFPFSWSGVVVPKRQSFLCQARGASNSLVDDLRDFVRGIGKAISSFSKKAYAIFLNKGWGRFITIIAFFVGFLTIICNTWILGYLNNRVLPENTNELTRVMEREVSLGKVNWVLPTGVIGMSPLMSVGPIDVGPGTAEQSQVFVPELRLGLDFIRSAFQRQIVLKVHCNETELRVVQADNFSWFGRPLDTTPSSSNFVPGLKRPDLATNEETVLNPKSFLGQKVDDQVIKTVAQLTEKLTKRRMSERKMSQYSCSTSGHTTSSLSDNGRHLVASLSTDISNENKPKKTVESKSEAKLEPKIESKTESKTQRKNVKSGRRMQLSNTPKETSHGIIMQHTIRERPLGKTLKPKQQQQRSIEHRRKKETALTEDSPASQASLTEDSILDLATPVATAKNNEKTPTPDITKTTSRKDSNPVSEIQEDKEIGVQLSKPGETKEEDKTASEEKEVSMEEVKSWVTALWNHIRKNIKLPTISIGSLHFHKSTVLAFITGEELPRELVNVQAKVIMSKGYQNLQVDIHGNVHKRNPESIKSTKQSSTAPKHLRFVTPGASKWSDRVFPDDIVPGKIAMTPSVQSNNVKTPDGVLEDGLYDVRHTPRKRQPPPSRRIRSVVPSFENHLRTQGPPLGGSLSVNVKGKDLFREHGVGELGVEVVGRNLHAPILERLVEIPIDIHDGRVDGRVLIKADSPRSWQFPTMNGKLKCRNIDMHFWDAPDHISEGDFEALLESNRLYFHEAAGYYGTLPITISGDMDVDPEYGEYRLTGVVSPVEVNVARASFGVRPMPNPVAGAVRGVVHCSGPLREPVFSGAISLVRPTTEMLSHMEDTHAKCVLKTHPQAVGAFDKVPFTSGKLLFTHDMGSDVLTLHDFVARPLAGGKVRGNGQMWVAPAAEHDPYALSINGEAQGVPARELMQNYLPEQMDLPKVLDLGAANGKLKLRGSHASPITDITWQAPEVQAEGDASLSRAQWVLSATAPSFDVSGTLHTQFLPFEESKHIYSQIEMTKLCAPKIVGIDSDISLKGCDMLPLFSSTNYPRHLTKSGQAARLKLSGKTQIKAQKLSSENQDQEPVFTGDVRLQGLRMNQLNLAKDLTGDLEVSSSGVAVSAKGPRADELLDFSIDLKETGDWLNHGTQSDEANLTEEAKPTTEGVKGARFSLKQGKLDISSRLNKATNQVQMQIRGLTLDELELASLRGDLQELSLDLNFLKREGRGEALVTTPRYSGLLGEVLSGGFRWERDVVRLEKMILQQKGSRYEVQGEYTLPTNTSKTEGEAGPKWIPDDVLVATSQPYIGRWRIQVNVPNADIQEILPAARLLSRATNVHERDYEKARDYFLKGLQEGGLKSPPLRDFVESAKIRSNENEAAIRIESTKELKPSTSSSSSSVLPGIQSLKGQWSGSLQAFGGGRGTSTLNFNLKGHSWKWGEYEVDNAVANGDAHFSLRGDLFGPQQDASFVLNDFPAALLNPLYKAVPALQNAVPVGTGHTIGIKRLIDRWEKTKNSLRLSEVKQDNPLDKFSKSSPVNGLLFVRGTIGGSIDAPQGFLNLDLYDGMIGQTHLSTAGAKIALGPQQEIEFRLDSTPLESKGFLKVEGTLPYSQIHGIGDVDIGVRIRDGGMSLIAALIPDFKWETGTADIDFTIKGKIVDPEVEGLAKVSRATLAIPNLKYPLKHTHGSIRVENGKLLVDNFETKSGNYGHIKAKGSIPVLRKYINFLPFSDDGLKMNISKLELKLNSIYNGRLDSNLKFTRCLKEPVVSGDIELSRGIMQLQFGALSSAPTTSVMSTSPGSRFQEIQIHSLSMNQDPSLASTPVLSLPAQVPMEGLRLEKLKLILGSELRFQVPFMVNLLLSGEVEVNGAPHDLIPKGTINLDGGVVNLFATQLSIDREDTPGTISFTPEQGFDPDLDITLTSPAEGFKAICQGKGSTWQKNVILRFRGVQGTDEENLSQAAKVFQTKLADALVAEDGQIALVNLAASTMTTMTPRLDTWGQIGAARWRLVSVPNISYFLMNSERLDFQDIVTTLLTGTEIEVQYGPTQAVVAHKLHGSTFGMDCNLSLNFTDNLKLTAGVANTPSTTTTTVLFEYNSEGRTRRK
eukprot:g7046.t1